VTVPDPALAAARSKTLAMAAAALSAAFVLLVVGLWVARGSAPSSTPSARSSAPAPPRTRAAAAAPAESGAPLPQFGRDRPVLDAAVAATVGDGAGD
jgi:hypothetical protein